MDKDTKEALYILLAVVVAFALYKFYKVMARHSVGTQSDGRVQQGTAYNPNTLPSSQLGIGGGAPAGAGGGSGGLGDAGQLAAGIGTGLGSILGGIGSLVKGLDGSSAGSGGSGDTSTGGDSQYWGDESSNDPSAYYN